MGRIKPIHVSKPTKDPSVLDLTSAMLMRNARTEKVITVKTNWILYERRTLLFSIVLSCIFLPSIQKKKKRKGEYQNEPIPKATNEDTIMGSMLIGSIY